MAKRLSRDDFLRNLRDSGLFAQAELDTTLAALPGSHSADGGGVAQGLIAAGKLTPFQAAAVLAGNFAELVIGNYQVLDRLGAGGMGTVYKARHRRMKRVVAIKVLSPAVAKSAKFVQRFQREVEAVARLSHANIVMAHDADEAEAGHFLVMEFVNGRDLATEVQQRGPLPVGEAVDCVVQAARAMDYAHGQGIIHRDIKPANLLLDISGVIKVADLGLARFNDTLRSPEEMGALTQAGTMMGTVDFMPPEQALGLTTIDHRADIYSLGCTLYFLLTGRPPYQGPTMMATLLLHREGPIPSLSAARSEAPATLDQVFQRMVAKKPDERLATMAEVVRALEALALVPPARPRPTVVLAAPQTAVLSPTVDVAPEEQPDTGVQEAGNQTVDVSPGEPGNRSPSVLLVEPSRTQAVIIRKYLDEIGFRQVSTVLSGQKALESARASLPQLVISAMHLADMTGIQLAQKMRAEAAIGPVGFVLIASQSDAEEANLLNLAGDTIRLHKPFDVDQLAQALVAGIGSLSRQTATSPANAPGRLRVLIVDDSVAARVHIRRVLEGLGLSQFVEAADGARAVAAAAWETFDLIVTDYNMPYMDGPGLVGYLKQNPSTASIPIIMVTTEEDPDKLAAVRQLGVAAVCDKTFSPEVVRQIIDQLVSTP